MPKVKNGNINIYYEIEGEGPPLLLYHFFPGSLEDWRDLGYVDALRTGYQLILMDARGHGKSDKPHDPQDYLPEHRVSDVIAILDDIGIGSTHFFGYSMGGRVGFQLARFASERIKSLIIGGVGARKPDPDRFKNMIKRLKAGPEAIVVRFEQEQKIPRAMRARLLANDHKALIAVAESLWPDFEDDLPSMDIPFLLFAGENDPVFPIIQEACSVLPHADFFSLSGANHTQALFSTDLVVPNVKEFLEKVY